MRMHGLVLVAALASLAPDARAQAAEASALITAFDQKWERGAAVVAEIGEMQARDQYLREIMIQGFHQDMSAATRRAYIDGTRETFDRVDDEHTRRLVAILEVISWQDLRALSARAAGQAFSLISHSNDLAFKKRMMAIFEPLALAGEMDGAQFAMLYDDIAQTEGRPQRYATNFDCRDGEYQPNPTEAPEQLNERRAALRMEPMDAYAARMREMYGACPTN